MRRFGALVCFFLLVGVPTASATAQTGHAETARSDATSFENVVPSQSTTAPRAQRARKLGAETRSDRITITLAFRPRRSEQLKALAARASGKTGIPVSQLRGVFGPSPTVTNAADEYLRRFGFQVSWSGILTRSYSGTVGAAEAAFRIRLARYKAGSVQFRRPTGAATLPSQLAHSVEGIWGLDTYPVYSPASMSSNATPLISASCSGPSAVQALHGGYQPAQLAASSGYNFQPLLDAGATGHEEVLSLLEFSAYSPTETAAYQSCYGTSVPNTDVAVNGGTTDTSGSAEVELDQEVAMTAAPGLDHIYTYIAPNGGGMAPVIDKILADQPTTGTTEISISWGVCELYVDTWDMVQTDHELELAAAAGISVFAASGDFGASDCYPATSFAYVDYPASSAYVTGVGGTSLYTAYSGSLRERAWGTPATPSHGGGGGGTSFFFTMPSWQSAPGVISSYSSTICSTYCREVPDVALDGNPNTGYIVRVDGLWTIVGGTSAAAPLLAAITADANSYSLSFGGTRVGFANPFFYQHAGTPLFRDVTVGSNSIFGGTTYPATAGYDMASGLGSPDALVYAQKLLGLTDTSAPAVTLTSPSTTYVTSSSPLFSGDAGTTLGDAGSVVVRIRSGTSASGPLVRTLTAPLSGETWSVTASTGLADGTYTVQAFQTDAAANVGQSMPVTFTIDTVAPTVTLADPIAGSYTQETQPTFSGTAGSDNTDAALVEVNLYTGTEANGSPVTSVAATRSGSSWLVTPSAPLADGTYTAQATQSDDAGNLGASAPLTFTADSTLDPSGLTATSTPEILTALSPVALHGVLNDETTGLPLAGKTVSIIGSYPYAGSSHQVTLHATTDSFGTWTVNVTATLVKARLSWHVLYLGSPGSALTTTSPQTLYVRPTLTTTSSAPWNGRSYSVAKGHTFTLKGTARPIMAGKRVTVQYRPAGGRWRATTIRPVISPTGRYSVKLSFKAAGKVSLRFAYTGSLTGGWLSAVSPGRLFVVK